jgi:hypothetical protein
MLLAATAAAAVLSSWSPTGALAHERRTVGPVTMRVGWANEPTYSGFMNAVQLFLSDTDKKPISGADDTLKVQVSFGDQKTAMLPLDASDEHPGEYLAPLIPDRPGNYTFHFVGTVAGQAIDQSFTSSSTTFDPVGDSSQIQFPAKDPSVSDVAGLVDRLGPRVDASAAAAGNAQAAAAQARTLGIAGLVLGAVGTLLGIGGLMKRAR